MHFYKFLLVPSIYNDSSFLEINEMYTSVAHLSVIADKQMYILHILLFYMDG